MTKKWKRLPRYSVKYKKRLVREVIDGGLSALEVARRYNVSSASMYRWLDEFGDEIISNFELNQANKPMSSTPKNESNQENNSSRIEELEEELRLEKLKREAYQQMIKVAEERFKISIKKKFGTKRSDK